MANSSNFSGAELPPETMAAPVTVPPDIITEILSRLPVKPLLRFRCVSKPWCYLIDSQEFAKKHLKQSVISNTNINLILGFQKSVSSFSLNSVHLTGLISPDHVEHLPLPPFSGSVMLNSCNGLSLVLIKKPQVSHLYIWNPFTRKYIELPDTPIEYPVGLEKNSLVADERYAFAYISETDEYKVVRVVDFSRFDWNWAGSWLGTEAKIFSSGSWLGTEAKIFSSTSNEWEKIEDFPYRLTYKRVWGAHKDGILHTVVKNGSSAWSIMGFDVKSKQHAVVPNPNLGVSEMIGITVEVLGGCLSLINQDLNDPKVDVWVMKDYGVKDSWSKLVSVTLESFEFSYGSLHYSGSLQPVAYSKDGEEVLLNEIDERLYWYNLKTGTEREVTINMPYDFYTEVCFESLVSFPGFISLGNVKGKSEGGLKKDSKEKKSNKNRGFSKKKDFKLVL